MRKIISAIGVIVLGLGLALVAATPAGATVGPNSPDYWEGQYPNAVECYKYDPPSTSNSHGYLADDGKAVVLNAFNPAWPGDRWEVLIVKSGSEGGDGAGNAVYPLPTAGTLYYGPLNGGGQQGTVSHWIVCKGETPPPVDVCENIDGDQATVPDGLIQDGVNCVEPEPEPQECAVTTAWGTEADDTPPTLTPDGYLFEGGSGNAVGYGLGISGNLQGLPEIAYVATGDLDVFYPRIVINSLADGGYAYDSLTIVSEGPVNGSSIAASNKRGFIQHTLDEWAALLPNNQLLAFFFHLDSGAAADKAVLLESVTGGCFSANFAPAVPEPISGEDVEEQVNCETGEVDITTTPWTQEQVWDAESSSYQPGEKVYGEPVVTHRELTEGEYVECYGEKPEPLSGSEKTEECDESILVITTLDWTQEYEAGPTGWVLGEKVYADPKVSRVAGDAACYFPPALAFTGDATSATILTGGLGFLLLGAIAATAGVIITRRRITSAEAE